MPVAARIFMIFARSVVLTLVVLFIWEDAEEEGPVLNEAARR